jgi:hypothetical protein
MENRLLLLETEGAGGNDVNKNQGEALIFLLNRTTLAIMVIIVSLSGHRYASNHEDARITDIQNDFQQAANLRLSRAGYHHLTASFSNLPQQ